MFSKREDESTISNNKKYTVVGTDIEEVKRLNANAGMSYREINEWFAKQQSKVHTPPKQR